MDLNLKGKVAVVTGGGSGIGRAIVKEYLKEGVQAAIFGKRMEVLKKMAADCLDEGHEIYYEALDITDTDALEAFAAHVYKNFGHIDIWVNNAGVAVNKEFSEFTQEDYDYLMKINLEGVFHGTQIAAKYMKKGNGGVIINASSFASKIPHVNGVIYAASKAAVSNMTKSTAAALAPYNIRVVGYIPGMIVSEISRAQIDQYGEKFTRDIAMARLGVPADLAKPVVFLSSEAAGYISGCDIEVTGGKFAVQDCNMAWRMKEGNTP